MDVIGIQEILLLVSTGTVLKGVIGILNIWKQFGSNSKTPLFWSTPEQQNPKPTIIRNQN